MPTLMQDHPGWTQTPAGTAVRVMRSGSTPWLLTWGSAHAGEVTVVPVGMPDGSSPMVDRVDPAAVAGVLPPLGSALVLSGPVQRVRNTDVWDAVGWSIIRQVIRAGQARLMYERFCTAHGEPVSTPHGTQYLFPEAKVVADLADADFDQLGMKFKAGALRAAATAFLVHGDTWQRLSPALLVTELCLVPRIGPWTAHATVADISGDFALYPYDDLAVRTWARRAAPGITWPDDAPAFASLWRAVAGEHLSALTLLTLAWGDSHVPAPLRL